MGTVSIRLILCPEGVSRGSRGGPDGGQEAVFRGGISKGVSVDLL
jgi:hypothetical protein